MKDVLIIKYIFIGLPSLGLWAEGITLKSRKGNEQNRIFCKDLWSLAEF